MALIALLAAGVFVVIKVSDTVNRVNVVAYFDSSNGIFEGDDVVILGVPVGRIDKIEPEPERVKISFWYDARHKVPADVNAAILSPMLVTSRAIQLTPAYSGVARSWRTTPSSSRAAPWCRSSTTMCANSCIASPRHCNPPSPVG